MVPTRQIPADLKAQARALSKNPWLAAVIVAIAVLAAGMIVFVRWTQGRTDSVVSDVLDLTEKELERIVKGLFVVLGADGAVHVHGTPVSLAETVRDQVARVASDAAMQRLESLACKGRPLSTLDLQVVNVTARSAATRQFSQITDTSQLLMQAG